MQAMLPDSAVVATPDAAGEPAVSRGTGRRWAQPPLVTRYPRDADFALH